MDSATTTPTNAEQFNIENLVLFTRNTRETAAKTEKDLLALRATIDSFIEAADSRCSRLGKMAELFSKFNLKDHHAQLDSILQTISRGMHSSSSHELTMNAQFSVQFIEDIDRFIQSWKNEKDFCSQQYQSLKKTTKKLKRNGTQTVKTEEQLRELREAKHLQIRVHNALQELKRIMMNLVHAQLYYHAQCFQVWSQVMYDIKSTESGGVTRKLSNAAAQQHNQNVVQTPLTPLTPFADHEIDEFQEYGDTNSDRATTTLRSTLKSTTGRSMSITRTNPFAGSMRQPGAASKSNVRQPFQ